MGSGLIIDIRVRDEQLREGFRAPTASPPGAEKVERLLRCTGNISFGSFGGLSIPSVLAGISSSPGGPELCELFTTYVLNNSCVASMEWNYDPLTHSTTFRFKAVLGQTKVSPPPAPTPAAPQHPDVKPRFSFRGLKSISTGAR